MHINRFATTTYAPVPLIYLTPRMKIAYMCIFICIDIYLCIDEINIYT